MKSTTNNKDTGARLRGLPSGQSWDVEITQPRAKHFAQPLGFKTTLWPIRKGVKLDWRPPKLEGQEHRTKATINPLLEECCESASVPLPEKADDDAYERRDDDDGTEQGDEDGTGRDGRVDGHRRPCGSIGHDVLFALRPTSSN